MEIEPDWVTEVFHYSQIESFNEQDTLAIDVMCTRCQSLDANVLLLEKNRILISRE